MDLPNDLRLAIERALHGVAAADLRQAAAALSARYRAGGTAPGGAYVRTPLDAAAYAAIRLPATFAAARAAMGALAAALPAWAPQSQLDAGAGLGATLWAGAETWPALRQFTPLELSAPMAELGARLAAARPALAAAQWRRADLLGPWEAPAHDLVSAAYLLGELPAARRAALVGQLWERAAGALLLIEPGTPAGFAAVRAARAQLIAAGATIVAPCPHQGACPMADGDWCHFAQRIARSKLQRSARGAELGYEDEKYAYLAAARQPASPIAGRLLRHPTVRPGRVELRLCAPLGLRAETITRSDPRWKLARDLQWGDALLD